MKKYILYFMDGGMEVVAGRNFREAVLSATKGKFKDVINFKDLK